MGKHPELDSKLISLTLNPQSYFFSLMAKSRVYHSR